MVPSNNHFDREHDKHNRKKIKLNPVASGEIPEKISVIFNIILACLIVLLTYVWFPSAVILIIAAILVVTTYSYRVKHIPILDLIFHGIWCSVFLIFPVYLLGIEEIILISLTVLTIASSNIGQFKNQLEDYYADKKAKLDKYFKAVQEEQEKMLKEEEAAKEAEEAAKAAAEAEGEKKEGEAPAEGEAKPEAEAEAPAEEKAEEEGKK